MNFFKIVLASAIGQVITWILVQGFVQSYWGKQAREELTRFWNKFSKHMRKQNET